MQTPIEERTVEWLVEGYIKIASQQQTGDNDASHSRHIHRSTVRSIFGPHASWLKGEVIDRKKILDRTSWNLFCEEYKGRRMARKRGHDWSESEEQYDDAGDGMEIDETLEEDDDLESQRPLSPDSEYDMINGHIDTVSCGIHLTSLADEGTIAYLC